MLGLLRYLNRMRLGQQAVYLEYPYDFSRRWGQTGNPHILNIVASHQDTYRANLVEMSGLLSKIEELSTPGPLAMNFANHFMPVLDGLSVMWAAQKAGKVYMEIGSGYSTIYARSAVGIKGSKTRIVSVDPHPRASIDQLCDEIIRQPVEAVDLSLFDMLGAGDVLFVDGSHRALTNSDVTVIMLDVLPRLSSGVLVGFHDIFLPFDYPDHWKNRSYNEEYMLAAYMLSNPDYLTLQLCNHWIWFSGMHVDPLADIWALVGQQARDRAPSALWAIVN